MLQKSIFRITLKVCTIRNYQQQKQWDINHVATMVNTLWSPPFLTLW